MTVAPNRRMTAFRGAGTSAGMTSTQSHPLAEAEGGGWVGVGDGFGAREEGHALRTSRATRCPPFRQTHPK